ncbi:MAG: hypothetical protein A2W90_14920 [Bacteroidetes bacterium GWF2_42_66]|nr:MAG: hypothetical protein A2W92_11085 [Bacteroidetes bacterium GWA2_42_15]OFX98982.1 MAG: hypothetical protein A2W89_06505 [Bacteroidetes bacterium GWE2_42_39]OFY46051.1 MAG: hypothetical protein A2W90_14920 [Bacteroidetes bacterium GWF2_42_66]HBL77218.1 hypothetical protein [Prolixibacteraceae bacterium]HCR90065.1 hypothetical protein [Prolixibacteraceae bacterium]
MKTHLIFSAALAAITMMLPSASLKAYNSKTEAAKFTLAPGDTASFPTNYVRVQTLLQTTVEFKSFQSFALGRGTEKTFAAGWIEITDTDVVIFGTELKTKTLEEDAWVVPGSKEANTVRERVAKEKERFPHGLDMRGVKKITVSINIGDIYADLMITTPKGAFTKVLNHWWSGGIPFVKNLGSKNISAELVFERKYADKPIWFMGDSYFNSTSKARWPYYMRMAGYTNWMADHLPGGNATQLLPCLKHDLEFGTPKIVVWGLLGNEPGDIGLEPNPNWMKAVTEFLAICKEKGITPVFILASSPGQNRQGKNNWIKENGYRYIDIPEFIVDHVDENGKCAWKDPSWLGEDKVHPTEEGAKIMWKAVERDLPELKTLN